MLFTCPVASLVDLMGPDVHGLFLLIIPHTRTPRPFSVSLKRCSGLDAHVVRSTLYVQKVAKNPLRRPSANHVCMAVVIAGSPVANAVQRRISTYSTRMRLMMHMSSAWDAAIHRCATRQPWQSSSASKIDGGQSGQSGVCARKANL